jgi:hypothetical protein
MKQLNVKERSDLIFEWIPYNKFIEINEIKNGCFSTSIWKDGPLYYSISNRKYKRKLNKEVLLKYLYGLQNINKFLNEVWCLILIINDCYNH